MLWNRCFPVNMATFLRITFFIEHLWWVPLVKLEPRHWNQQTFSSSYFWLNMISWAPSTLRQNSCKTRYLEKIFVLVPIHTVIETLKQFAVIIYPAVEAFLYSQCAVLWNSFINDLSVKNISLFSFYKKKIVR